jgi:hypothetical protein
VKLQTALAVALCDCDGEDSPTFLAAMSEMTLLLELVLLSTAIQGEGF